MDNPIEVSGSIATAHYRTELHAEGHLLIADEGFPVGGADTGPPPAAFLAASLASCTAITLRMYADRKGWNMTQATVHVTITQDKSKKITRINRTIALSGALSAAEKTRLLEIANKCPVHLVLTNPIEITSSLET